MNNDTKYTLFERMFKYKTNMNMTYGKVNFKPQKLTLNLTPCMKESEML